MSSGARARSTFPRSAPQVWGNLGINCGNKLFYVRPESFKVEWLQRTRASLWDTMLAAALTDSSVRCSVQATHNLREREWCRGCPKRPCQSLAVLAEDQLVWGRVWTGPDLEETLSSHCGKLIGCITRGAELNRQQAYPRAECRSLRPRTIAETRGRRPASLYTTRYGYGSVGNGGKAVGESGLRSCISKYQQ